MNSVSNMTKGDFSCVGEESIIDVGGRNIKLMKQLLGDVAIASTVSFGIAPFISIIDKSVVQRAAGTHTISHSIMETFARIVHNPIIFFRSPAFLLMFGVYGSTYATANCIKTIQDYHLENEDVHRISAFEKSSDFGAMALTTAVNSSTSMMKDKFYASQFNGATTTLKMPMVTFGLWGIRDFTTIASSFLLPRYIADIIQNSYDFDGVTAHHLSQIICPMVAQVVATPVHMLGLDYFNRPLANLPTIPAFVERVRFQYNNFSSIFMVRVARVAPAYCIGGVGNNFLRDAYRQSLEQ